MLDRNNDGKVDLKDLEIFINELDGFADNFISHEPTSKAIDAVKSIILPLIELLDGFANEGIDAIKDIRDDWKTFIDMLDDGKNPIEIAMQFKKVVDETRENIQEIADLINDAGEQIEVVKGFIAHFRVEAPKAIAEFKADTARHKAEKADEFAAMSKHWAEGDKLESIKIFLKDGTVYALQQTVEFFDLLGDLAKAGAISLRDSKEDVTTDDVTTDLVAPVVETTVDDA